MITKYPAMTHAIVAAVVTAVVGVLVGKGWIVDPSPEAKETIITAVAGAASAIAGWLTHRKVTPVATPPAGGA